MNFEQGLYNLENVLKQASLAPDSNEYLNFVGWRRQLRDSIENERRFAVLSRDEQERRERVFRELDRLALRYVGKSFLELCAEKYLHLVGKGLSKTLLNEKLTPKSPTENISQISNAYALVIGVGDYMHDRYSNLPATVRDAQTIAGVLTDPNRCGYPRDNVQIISGEQATVDGIRNALKTLSESTNPQSNVFVYFSGHGGCALENGNWRAYICPREADPNKLIDSAISGDNFSTILKIIPARRMLIVLDACHASGSIDLKAVDGTTTWKAGLPENYYESLSQGSGRVVIASSKADQASFVRSQGDLSVFTWHFREALMGKAAVRGDGLIHVLDIFHYVNEMVQKERPDQTPILKVSDMDLNFAIALDRGGKGVGTATITSVSPITNIREQIVHDPVNGAKALSEFLKTRSEWAAKRNEVDLKRSDLERIQHELELFGPNDNDKAAKSRIVFFLLRICLEIE